MLPVAILAKYNSSVRSAVSERPNSKSGLVFDRSNSSTRLCRTVLQSRQGYSPAACKHFFDHDKITAGPMSE